ncbi:MAG TPA: hypothetical protein VIQ52_19845, partial [Arthrobacter sp.]
MGNSGKFAVIAAVAALGMLVLTAITLEEAVMVTFLGLLALAYVSAVAEVLVRGRRLALLATGAGTSLTIAFSLAFLSTWELAFANQSSFLGTPLPTGDPDNYFYWAAASAVSTLLVLFLGAVWPSGRRLGEGRRRPSPAKRRPAPAARRPAARGASPRGTATGRTAAGGTASGGTAQQRAAAQRTAAQRTSAPRTSGQGASGSRAPARLPAAAAKRPPSSESPVR